jgi:hypothetical protein
MTPKFMRQEAARFRDMASTSEREASRVRLLAMADDYDARANAAEPQPAHAAPVAAIDEPPPPKPAESPAKLRLSRRTTRDQTEAV